MKKQQKIVLCSAYNKNYEEIGNICTHFLKDYCKKNNINYVINREENLSENRPFAWGKVRLIQRLLSKYDWVIWIDSDALILNQNLDFSVYLEDELEMIFVEDQSGINTGVSFFKGSKYNAEFLERVWNEVRYINHPWWEQKAIRDFYKNDEQVRNKIKILKKRDLNANEEEWVDGESCIFHQTGKPYSIRQKKEMIDRMIIKYGGK